jgi:hypothetical protein
MPRRKSIRDDEIRRALAASFGVRSAAAHSLGISPTTLARRLNANPKLAISDKEIEKGREIQALLSIYNRAMAGDLAACIWWLKNQAGWTMPHERPQRTPRKMPLDPNCTFKLIKDSD